MSIERFDNNPTQYNPAFSFQSAEETQKANNIPEQIATHMRESVDQAVKNFFDQLAPVVMESHRWEDLIAQVMKHDMMPLLLETTKLIQGIIGEFDFSPDRRIEELHAQQLTNFCLEFPLSLIAMLKNPVLLNECEKVRRDDLLISIHEGLCMRWGQYLPLRLHRDADTYRFKNFNALERFWLKYAPNDKDKKLQKDINNQKEFFRALKGRIDAAWKDLCRQKSIILTDLSYYNSSKERFLTYLLEKCWLETDGDLSTANFADIALLVENRNLIKKANLGKIHALNDKQLVILAKTFTQLEDLRFCEANASKDNFELTSKGIEALTSLSNLTTLKLYQVGLKTQKQLIRTLPKLPKLRDLRLEQFTLDSDAVKHICSLALQSLALVGGNIDKEAFHKHAIPSDNGIGGLSALESLELRNNIGESHAAISPEDAIKLLQHNPSIQELCLISSDVSDKHLYKIAKTTKNLRFLDLSECDNIGAGAVELVKSNPKLEALVLRNDQSIAIHIPYMAKATRNLIIMDIRYLGEAPTTFASYNNKLVAATLYHTNLDDATLTRFARKATGLQSATITVAPNVTDKGLASFGSICTKLQFAGFVANGHFSWKYITTFAENTKNLIAISLETFREQIGTDIIKKILEFSPNIQWLNIYPEDESVEQLLTKHFEKRAIRLTSYPHDKWVNITIMQSDS